MHCHGVLRRAAIFGAVATAGLLALVPRRAQTPGPTAASAAPVSAAAPRAAACAVSGRPGAPRSFRLRGPRASSPAGKPIKIVALGSSSTYGAGASTSGGILSEPAGRGACPAFPGARDHGAQPRRQRRRGRRHARASRHRRDRRKARSGAVAGRHQLACCATRRCCRTPRCCTKGWRASRRPAPKSC